MRRAVLPLILLLGAAAPAFGQDGPPPEVHLPDGVQAPDLSGYEVVVVKPDDTEGFIEAVNTKSLNDKPTAWLFAEGYHDHGETAFKKLWRNRRGTASAPHYIGPLDRSAPLPDLNTEAFLAGSGHLVIQGLILKGLKIVGIAGEPRGLPVTVEGCWIDGGVSIQAGKNEDGSFRMPGDALIRRCWLMDSSGQGVYSDHSLDCRIVECVIDYAGASPSRDHAIYLSHTKNFVVERCIITRPSSSAYKDNASEGAVLRDCLIAGAHSWASVNNNPSSGSSGEQGRDFLAEGNVITAMRRRTGEAGGIGFFGWSYKGLTIRDNFFVQNPWDRSIGAMVFQPPFYNAQYAGPLEDVVISRNVFYGYRGDMILIKKQPDLKGMTVTGNVVGEPEEWDGTIAHTDPLQLGGGVNDPSKFGLSFSGNFWPRWAPLSPWAEHFDADNAGKITVRNPNRTLARLAGKLGEDETEEAFYALLRTKSPHVVIDKALDFFRTGYRVTKKEAADPPESLPWLDEDDAGNEVPPGPDEGEGETKTVTIVEFTIDGVKHSYTVDAGSVVIREVEVPAE